MLTITIIIYGIVGVFIDRKANKAQDRIDALQSALVLLEKNTNDKTKELQSKIDALTALKIEDLTDALTAASDLTPKQKLNRLARAKQATTLAFEIVKNYGTTTPLHEKTQKLMLLLLERAEKLAQAQLVAEGGKTVFERGGVVKNGSESIGKVYITDSYLKELRNLEKWHQNRKK